MTDRAAYFTGAFPSHAASVTKTTFNFGGRSVKSKSDWLALLGVVCLASTPAAFASPLDDPRTKDTPDQRFEKILADAMNAPEKADWKSFREAFSKTTHYHPYSIEVDEKLKEIAKSIGRGETKESEAALLKLIEQDRFMRFDGILLIAGLSGVCAGLLMSPWLPLIKRIWTPSFAVYAGGWTTLMLLAFYWSIEVMGWKRWAFPLVVVGTNSIAAYVLGNSFGGWFRSLTGAWIGGLREPFGVLWFPVFQHLVVFALEWLVLYWLWKRRIFFKV